MPFNQSRLRERYWRATNLKLDPLHQEFSDWRHPNENTAAARGLVHPARFSYKLYEVFADLLRAEYGTQQDFMVLDPFAGIGGVHNLPFYIENALTFGIEIERDWAECHPNTMHANAFFLDRIFAPDTFDAVVTSPSYGNRMADTFTPNPSDTSKRLTYTLSLGRRLTPGNTGALQWGKQYRDIHYNIWRKCFRVVRPGGLFILNIKDHIREKQVVPVTDFHIDALTQAGFYMESHDYVALNGFRFGKNFKSRMKHESVIQFRKPFAP